MCWESWTDTRKNTEGRNTEGSGSVATLYKTFIWRTKKDVSVPSETKENKTRVEDGFARVLQYSCSPMVP